MKLIGRTLVVALALLLALPSAQARPKLGPAGLFLVPLAIVGGIAGAALGSRKARAHRHHYRPNARRDRGSVRRGREPVRSEPAAVRAVPEPEPSPMAQSGWAGPLFWPHAYDGVFEYAFGLPGDDDQFWARGFGDVIDGMFMPPASSTASRARGASRSTYQPARNWEGLCGSEAPKAAEATVDRIRQLVQPTPGQDAVLGELRAALIRATERIEMACPTSHAATPPERLRMMIARLTAMRQAVLTVQGPLRAFYKTLGAEQKSALERAGSEGEAGETRAEASADVGCAAPVANWPQRQIERVLQPTKAQRALLDELRQRSLGFAQFVASTCPREVPRTALERLEAVKERLAVLRYAASNVSPVFDAFYGSLSDAQKARFQSLARERRADSAR